MTTPVDSQIAIIQEFFAVQDVPQNIYPVGTSLILQKANKTRFIGFKNGHVYVRRSHEFRVHITGKVRLATPTITSSTASFAISVRQKCGPCLAEVSHPIQSTIVTRNLPAGFSEQNLDYEQVVKLRRGDILSFDLQITNVGTGVQAQTVLPSIIVHTVPVTGDSVKVRIYPLFAPTYFIGDGGGLLGEDLPSFNDDASTSTVSEVGVEVESSRRHRHRHRRNNY